MVYDIDVLRLVKQVKHSQFVHKHAHKFYHYIFVLSGTGAIEVDNVIYEAKACTLFAVPPGIEHAVFGFENLCAIDVKFSVGGTLKQMCDFGTYVIPDLSNYELSLVTDMFDEAVLSLPDSANIINSKMIQLILLLARQNRSNGTSSHTLAPVATSSILDSNYAQIIAPALNYVDNNLCSPLTVAQLAELCGYSDTYFSSVFSSLVGITPKKYINIKKIERAKHLILSSSMNITQISEHLGFDSIHYFSRTFKRITGISPMAYLSRANSNMGINVVKECIPVATDGFEFRTEKLESNMCDNLKKNIHSL